MDRNNKNNKAWSWSFLTVCCFALVSTRALAAGVEVDGATSTSLDAAPNGVPIVNIARPNTSGLSHNTYRSFNVESNGLILNNATRSVVKTQLGGQILGNSRLSNPARVILNEVTSTNRSYLTGYTEVAGQGADIVIANPNGISINGAGFINSSRVTLTTGHPQIDLLGNLGGFDVRGGEIAIEGDGLNTSLQDFTSIYTHFLKLNASLHARDLDVALGKNKIDYPGRKIVTSGKGTVNRVLLDSSMLGGMYADKIVLVGTDQGLGMNLPPEVIASTGDIEISNDGRLLLNKLDAGGNIRLQATAEIESKDTVYAAGAIEIQTLEEMDIKAGMIAAAGPVTLRADLLDNKAVLLSGLGADGSMISGGLLEIEAGNLLNANEIVSSGGIEVEAAFVTNRGLFSTGENLVVSAGSLVNEATLFSANDTRLFVKNSLDNTADASIFTVDNLLLAADVQNNRSGRITNDLGLIQSLQGDIDIHADRFENLGFGDLQYQMIHLDLGNGREVSDPADAMTINLAYSSGYTKHKSRARSRWINEVLNRLSRQAPLLYQANASDIRRNRSASFLAIETRLIDNSTTIPAYLDSGNELNLNVGEYVNDNAVTAAASNINFNIGGNYLNQALSATENIINYQYSVRAKHSRNWKSDDKYSSIGRSFYIPVARTRTVSTNTVTQAGGNISGSVGGQAVNSGVLVGQYQSLNGIDPADYSQSSVTLPANDFGLFTKTRAPDSQYLIETNPRFTRFGNFVSSRYLLDRLDFSATATLKRLGDAFYEAKLIRDSVFAQSGRRFLDPAIQNDNDQFQYLMDNALIAQTELRLAPGVALEADQINRLARDIVWLEAQEIDGELVLVPTVYLANRPRPEVRGGRIIAGGDSRLVLASLTNGGLIEANKDLSVQASDDIRNRGIVTTGETLNLEADGDIENVSGLISAREVAIASREGSITNRRAREQYSYSRRDLSYSITHLGEAGKIESSASLELKAKQAIELSGSDISGGQVTLDANSIDITTATQSEHYKAGDKRNHVTESSTRHFASTVNGDQIVILSPGAVRIDGSKVSAARELQISSGSIDIGAVNDAEYYARLNTSDKTLGESVSSHKSFRSNNIGSQLSGTTVVLVTEHGDIEITGSDIDAQSHLVMNSSHDIRISAGHDDRLDETYKHESGWFSGNALYSETEDLDGRASQMAVSSRIKAGTLDLNAAEDIELNGVEISVDERMTAIAQDISVSNTNNQERTYKKHTETTVSLDDLASNMEDFDKLVNVEDGKLKVQLGSAVYENLKSSTRQTTAIESRIEAASIEFDAGRDTVGDITIEGSDLSAEDTISLNASGDVALLDARHEFTREDLTQKGSAVLNFTVKNEYEQVARALKAVRDAERDLGHARDDYDDYKDELKKQKAELGRLNLQYESGEGFVEQADISDFKRRLARLKDDEEYYETNIALATATLVSKTTALIQQVSKAASSSGTYGFNMGIELDIDAFERDFNEYQRQSRASNLSASLLSIRAGDDAWLRGANLVANDRIDILAQDIDIFAGTNVHDRRDREQHVNFNYSWDLMGGGPGVDSKDLGGAISGEGSLRDNQSTYYTNSQLLAQNIRLVATGDATIRGAEVVADEKLEIVSENLDVASVQNISSTDFHSQGMSYSRSGTGANAAEGYSEILDTKVTRLLGNQVDITVDNHTELEGAVIASVDAKGQDSGRLRLVTETLNAGSLNNTSDSDNRSLGLSVGETSTLDYLDETRETRTKSLATLGKGDLQINDTEGSNTRFLNTNIEETEVSIFDIGSHQGLSGELDIRLLSESGRDRIVEDWIKAGMIGNTIKLIAKEKQLGINNFFSETEKSHTTYEAIKKEIAGNPDLAETLQNPDLDPEHKEAMLNQLTQAAMQALGYDAYLNNIIATGETGRDGQQVYGFYSIDSGQAYINDRYIDDTSGLVSSAGHEATRAMEHQDGVNFDDKREERADYARNFGENFARYTDHALDINGYDDGLATMNNHVGNSGPHVQANNQTFAELDKSKGDNYLNHEDSKKYNLVLNALFDCDSNGGCSNEQMTEFLPEAVRLLNKDKLSDERLQAACQIASSPECIAEVGILKDTLDSYLDLPNREVIFEDGTHSEFQDVGYLYGKYRSVAMEDNAKKALVSIPIDTVSGIVDLAAIVEKAGRGDQAAQQQLSVISQNIQNFVKDPINTIEQGVKSRLEEAQRFEDQGDINRAQQIRSRVFLEGAFSVVGVGSGVLTLVRTGVDAPDVDNGIVVDSSRFESKSNPSKLKINSIRFDEAALRGQIRQEEMLYENHGFNLSGYEDEIENVTGTLGNPVPWNPNNLPGVPEGGATFITDEAAFTTLLGELPVYSKTLEVKEIQLRELEVNLGLQPGSLGAGSVLRKFKNIRSLSPASPLHGNEFFRGSGFHLKDGAPEVIINPAQERINNTNIIQSWTVEVIE